jgi:hypothetical protein
MKALSAIATHFGFIGAMAAVATIDCQVVHPRFGDVVLGSAPETG